MPDISAEEKRVEGARRGSEHMSCWFMEATPGRDWDFKMGAWNEVTGFHSGMVLGTHTFTLRSVVNRAMVDKRRQNPSKAHLGFTIGSPFL